MATRTEHHRTEAERLLTKATETGLAAGSPARLAFLMEASVHASLAVLAQGPEPITVVQRAELPGQTAIEIADQAVVDLAKPKPRTPRTRKPKPETEEAAK